MKNKIPAGKYGRRLSGKILQVTGKGACSRFIPEQHAKMPRGKVSQQCRSKVGPMYRRHAVQTHYIAALLQCGAQLGIFRNLVKELQQRVHKTPPFGEMGNAPSQKETGYAECCRLNYA